MNTVPIGQIIDVPFAFVQSCPAPAGRSIALLLPIASMAISLTTDDAIVIKSNPATFADIFQNNCTIISWCNLRTIAMNYLNHLM
jgi:hypothetical protein